MKHLFTAAAMLFSMTAFAQVGINNTSPKATLDITAKTTDGSKPEGLIIPQLSGSNIHTATAAGVYGTNQKGLIIYATSADSSPTSATANITAAGYYYFDGGVWQKIGPNIYNTDGALTGTRTVNTVGNSLRISGGGQLVVQTADNSGKIRLSPADTSHTGYMEVIKGDNTRLGYIGWDNANVLYNAENGASHVLSGGKVGVGLIPEATLDIVSAGTAFTKNAILSRPASGMDSSFILKTSTGNITSNPGDITNTFGQAYGANGALSEGFEFMRGTANSDGSLAIKTAGIQRMRIDSNGNVGIGTATPGNLLEINNSSGTNTGLKLPTGAGSGKTLVSDINGNAVWQSSQISQFQTIVASSGGYLSFPMSSGTWTLFNKFTNVIIDEVKATYGSSYGWDTTNQYYKVPKDGKYRVTANVYFNAGTTGENWRAMIQLNNSGTYIPSLPFGSITVTTNDQICFFSGIAILHAGDLLNLKLYNTSSTNPIKVYGDVSHTLLTIESL